MTCDNCHKPLGRDAIIWAKDGLVCCKERCLHEALKRHADLIVYDTLTQSRSPAVLCWVLTMAMVALAVMAWGYYYMKGQQ
jgi:hypothetical protein